ncbi:penicillin-binding transpeptidase domain-containing protein [soil metagenome]
MMTRLRVLLALIFTVMVLFTARLMYLQVVMAKELSVQSDQNVRVEKRSTPLRGRILARDGTVLADNRIAYDLMYWGGDIRNWQRLAYLLGLSAAPAAPDRSDLEQAQFGAVVAYNVPDTLVPAVEELVAGQDNLYLRERVERTYPTNLAAQVVGYTAEAKGRFEGYALDDLVGVTGIEASFQDELFGEPGKLEEQVDNHGVVLESTTTKPVQAGRDLVLTLDPKVQRMAEDALAGALPYVNEQREKRGLPLETVVRGALVALNPKTGEILAMASSPTFDQNVFTKRPSNPAEVKAVLSDTTNLPMSNRAVETYPPASTFKLVTSSALLEDGFVSPTKQYYCSASITFGGIRWDNWSYPSGRGTYDATGALADSCNTYYWLAVLDTPGARKAGWSPFIDALVTRAQELGYGRKVGVGLLEEKAGRVPDEAWANEHYEYGWLPGFTLNTSIGQGDMLATPVQVAQLVETIAEDGRRVKPHLVRKIGGELQPPEVTQVPGRYWSTLQTGMRKMITDYGTQYVLGPRAFPIDVAGKSGTAQNSRGLGYDHVWFTGFAPLEDPEIVWTIFIENGDKSTATAVPAGRDFLKQYFGVEDEN